MSPADRARAGFIDAFGQEPVGVVFAPGRVNLMGEHVDYNAGLVLPLPITVGTAVAWGPSADAEVDAVALDLDQARDRFTLSTNLPHAPADWRSYVRGMASCLAVRGHALSGARLAICGDIPRGAGLSSSASLCIAVGRALVAASGTAALPPRELALAAQAAEHHWAGVHCGIMDQMAVAAGEQGHALLLDCRDLSTRSIALPADWAVLIVQSGIVRGLVDGHYNARRADCDTAARALGVTALRDADAEQITAAALDPLVRRRALHVVQEIARTGAAATAIETADLPALGELMRASHASLRDQFEVSMPPVDALADLLNLAIGANGGARMTGGGFGGAVVAVLADRDVPRVLGALEAGYAAPGGGPNRVMIEGAAGIMAGVAV